ncbi:MAG: three-Cys-motif partner protein TcmP, partial [Candidatus Heimdallarchaeaceae archaeon]
MPLEFKDDAICLSGEMGTKLKSEIIGEYYNFWWNITSGGVKKNNILPTAIIEMDAATGKAYIQETDEFVLGSAGHALELKCSDYYKTRNLALFLIEVDKGCFDRLLRNISKICSKIPENLGKNQYLQNEYNIFLSNKKAEDAISELDSIKNIGNSLFFFDPLLCVEWELVEKVASKRITKPYKTGTEFILFNFTSDWFLGRGDFHPLPKTTEENKWTQDEKNTVQLGNNFFGDDNWKDQLLYDGEVEERQERMVSIYRYRLNKWFRFVLPLPFSPKENQLYHLFLCSNYEAGVNATKNFYAKKTNNPKYQPNNQKTF